MARFDDSRYRNKPGYVYLIHAQGTTRYKIGITTRTIEARLAELDSSQSAFPLALIDAIRVKNATATEQELHTKYKRYRRHGEWFEFSPRLVGEVRREFKKITGRREYLTQNQLAILWGIGAFVLGFLLVILMGGCQGYDPYADCDPKAPVTEKNACPLG